ncbi:MAG TPA: mechanosensitive ion channel [Oscillatoriales cyanobacterium M59_W2019_021]|nr:mechanosensitive ion channel [Oscillatoriales cyanobacterium M4454_W2019_049]HIK51114.1 mechanosensitive ion channel [Oscillatoriales cyanobacterium M59_W2019_021]
MAESLSITLNISDLLKFLAFILGAIAIFILGRFSIPILLTQIQSWESSQIVKLYQALIQPQLEYLGLVVLIAIAESLVLLSQAPEFIEIGVSLLLTISIISFGWRLIYQLFDVYLLKLVVQSGSKINELLNFGKIVANGIFIVVSIFIFLQSHNINLLGLIASLGIGGLAVAFAAQKTLEQLLGGIVLYLDKPFTIDDYVSLPDGTFGRIESIGLRSTKIRLSGKGTLAIVPNNALTQMTIENLTGAKKVIAIVYLNFYRLLPEDEKSLIRQVVIQGTIDIFGIDSRNTEVEFRNIPYLDGEITQAQIAFFILGSGNVSMELRRQVLDLANQNINQTLVEHGIEFEIEDSTIYVDSPITI